MKEKISPASKVPLRPFDSLFTPSDEAFGLKTAVEEMPIDKLVGFEDHPFHVTEDEEMEALVESIEQNGILSPLIVRPIENGKYEIVSGHRRKHAAELAGLTTVPVCKRELSRDEAVLAMVDSNLHREHLLPSEKAFAYKMKLEAIKHQGQTSGQLVPKSDDNRSASEIGSQMGESYKTVQRFIRLTNLIPELLRRVDSGEIALTPAYELSFLTAEQQRDVVEEMSYSDVKPSLAQAKKLRQFAEQGRLSQTAVGSILMQPKANQKELLSIPAEKLSDYFPAFFTAVQKEQRIIEALEFYNRHLEKTRVSER